LAIANLQEIFRSPMGFLLQLEIVSLMRAYSDLSCGIAKVTKKNF